MRVSFIIYLGAAAAVLSAQSQPAALPADLAERLAALERESAAHPGTLETLDALAGSYAMAGRYQDAIRVVEQMIARGGTDRDLYLRLAQLYSWSGENERALAALGRIRAPLDSKTAEFRCQVLSASAKAAAAAECYGELLTREPLDAVLSASARLALARNLAWSGRRAAALSQYRIYQRAVPGDRTAAMEWIRLLLQSGSYGTAERVCNELLSKRPDDAAVLALKSEVLHWSGRRSREALRSAQAAAALDPALPDARIGMVYALRDLGLQGAAREGFRSLEGEVQQAGGVSPEATYAGAYRYLERQFQETARVTAATSFSDYQDSDSVRDRTASLRATMAAGDHLLHLEFDRFSSLAPAASVFSSGTGSATVTRALAGVDLHLAPGMTLQAAAGGYRVSEISSVQPAFEVAWIAEPVDRWVFRVSAAHEPVPLTPKSIVRDVANYGLRGSASYALDSRTTATVEVEQRRWSDGNRSMGADASMRRVLKYSRALSIDTGPWVHFEGYRRDMLSQSGYFSPDSYARYEGFLGVHGEIGKRAQYEVRGDGGEQRLAQGAPFRQSSAISSSVRLHLGKRFDLVASGQWRNYSLLYQGGWYRQVSAQLEIRQ